MTTFTPNLTLQLQTPGDPAVKNAWGTNLNTNFSLLDNAIAGRLILSVAGNTNVVLTDVNGAASQSRNMSFSFGGALTGNILVLFPASKARFFIIGNSTSGAFTLGVANNNGSGGAAGAVATIPQGYNVGVVTDGTGCAVLTQAALPSGGVATVSGGGAVNFASGGQSLTLDLSSGSGTITLPPSGNVPSVTVSGSGPSGNPGITGAIWAQV